jgi:carotenoid phi-ring synthase / carotenoid chi-ring synthase
MKDERRVVHPAPDGAPDVKQLPHRPHVVVVGAGIAGLAAATGLAERGVSVELLERQEYLGGRVGGWTDQLVDGTQVANNRGFHAFFRQYYNLRMLLRRTDPQLERLREVDDYPLVDAEGRRDTSGCETWSGSTQLPPPRWPPCRCRRSTTSSTSSTPKRS